MHFVGLLVLSLLIFMLVFIVFMLAFRKYMQFKIARKSKLLTARKGLCSVETVTIGKMDQSILIQACDKEKQVMLVLHGGPGMPFPGVSCKAVENVTQMTTGELMENFVMVYWDQRGTGKSYHADINPAAMTIERYIQDANELVDLLRDKFNTEKIYLAGISWGSVIGLNLIQRYSEKFIAYFGLPQIINWTQSDKLAYPWALEYAKAANNVKAVQKLTELGLPPYNENYKRWRVLRNWLMKFGGYSFSNDQVSAPNPLLNIKSFLLSPDYSFKDIINTFKGMKLAYSQSMIKDFGNIDFLSVQHIDIPVCFFQGRHDKTQPGEVFEPFFDQLNAPAGKELVYLENSAHFFNPADARKVEQKMISFLLSQEINNWDELYSVMDSVGISNSNQADA